MSDAAESVPTPPAEKASLFEDFIDILYAPSQVFARREKAGFWVVTLILAVLIGGLFYANQGVTQSIMDAEFNRQMAEVSAKNPSLTPEQLAGSRKMMESVSTVSAFFFAPIIVLLLGLCVWLVSKLFGATMSYGAACMITAYAYIPRAIEGVVTAVQGLLLDTSAMTGRYHLSLGVGRFLDPDTMNPGLISLLGRVDVFTIWVTVLLGIGISVVGKIPRQQGMLAAAALWVLGALPAVWQLIS